MGDAPLPRYVLPITVRFRDVDAMGHVNNAVYLTYFEEARVGYYAAVTGEAFEAPPRGGASLIAARASLDFRSPAYMGETLLVGCRTTWAGRSSLGMDYRVTADEASSRGPGRVVAEGQTVIVTFDYELARPVPIPVAIRAAIEAWEGGPLPTRPPR
jgi:acyl-CoA thioester hydrolase